ncbi:phosphomannomutase [Alkalimonas delamerensis]|uniref:Phosphomannomutase n=1 Tax=Alkalimonas delamerensis TaxID=265981 RepID=A0ABT9GMD8_9GAMM|nr:phosphomannomutase [Alkalimonas delamerensis]MDP4528138.1 phosphomannomutase [Alkalimonas delamerensis]
MAAPESSKQLIANSGIAFGTSGARGLVEQFSPEVCAAFAINFAKLLQQQGSVTTLDIAIDNRPSSYAMAQACAAGLAQLGMACQYHGVLPTPALAHFSMAQQRGCIMITGSHIPFDRNGIKFYRPDGEISKADEAAIVQGDYPIQPLTALPALSASDAAQKAYCSRYLSTFPANLLKGKTIGLYQHSAAGRDLYPALLEALGATVIPLGRSDAFVPIDTEAVSADDRAQAKAWTRQHQLDALFSTDGDGDRPLLADEQGHYFTGDVLGLLCSDYLGICQIAVPVSCTTALEKSGRFAKVLRTRIGSPYVIAALGDLPAPCAGFEANGGYLLGSDCMGLAALPTRDALLPALACLALAGEKPLSTLRDALPKRFTASDRLQQFAREQSDALLARLQSQPATLLHWLGSSKDDAEQQAGQLGIDTTDGLRITLPNQDIVHLRPSGNAPELRCYAEAQSQEQATKLMTITLKAIQQH